MVKDCYSCGAYDEDYGCTIPSIDKWYACPIESEYEENKKKLEEYIEWCEKRRINAEDLSNTNNIIGVISSCNVIHVSISKR